ncbi:uncharacterized protein GGS22DRAFT_175694 [Annulohypoxylon maeteangense]|uniref:uncharacterized protein n=1 Tax=Annulohypoxylon maeteangense TaxID=1927788 RepID=UPI00200735D4|nr:uncharacterized protein GGS22DRAFT_175694 [Annulohypoxylon maeteangense]KAI0880168.1 hypothetical protein GGS22DRAFT_175694 [Annulohypoxylon maeteangense]
MVDRSEDAPSAPSPVYQLPDWETITHPPKPRQSLLSRILPSKDSADEPPLEMSAHPSTTVGPVGSDQAKESSGQASTLPSQTSQTLQTYPPAIAENSSAKPTFATPLRAHLDSALPPHKTYLGRPRRFLFLYIVLPLAIFLFVLAPLAIGLGVGLPRRSQRNK